MIFPALRAVCTHAKGYLQRFHALHHHVYEYGHFAYFGLVALHGPYELAAGGLLVLGVLGLLLFKE